MKIAIFGVGGVGGYFGGRLAASGVDVSFIARGTHMATMQQQGLTIESDFGNLRIDAPKVTNNPTNLEPVDLILFSVKLYDVEAAAQTLKPLLKPETVVISLQNGINTEARLSEIIGQQHVAGGVAYISATIAAPGVIKHLNKIHKLSFGELDGQKSPRLERFAALCKKAGFDAEVSADIRRDLWEKFAFLAPMAAATALTRQSIGNILVDPDLCRLFTDLANEAAAVAKAEGIDLGVDSTERRLKMAANMPAGMKASLAHDLEKGNRLEIEGILGDLVRRAEIKSLSVPTIRTAYAALKPYADGKKA